MRRTAVLLLAAVSVAGVSQTTPANRFRHSAHQFVKYYRTLETSTLRTGFLDRVALSLALTRANQPCETDPAIRPSS